MQYLLIKTIVLLLKINKKTLNTDVIFNLYLRYNKFLNVSFIKHTIYNYLISNYIITSNLKQISQH